MNTMENAEPIIVNDAQPKKKRAPRAPKKNVSVTENSESGDSIENQNNVPVSTNGEKKKTARAVGVKNKGTGAGGANTNKSGKEFEAKTLNHQRLLNDGFIAHSIINKPTCNSHYYLSKKFEDKTVIFVIQQALKNYMQEKYNIEMFRCPDEAYIIEYATGRKVIKILEKKAQQGEGSVETKLWAGASLKREYQLVLGAEFDVVYGFCLSEYLKKKMVSNEAKYNILNAILNENNITVLFGDDENYFETFDAWFNDSL